MWVTSSNLNLFSKFFHHWKEKEISNKIRVLASSHHILTMLPNYLWKIKISNLSQIRKKMQTKKSHEPVKFPQLSEDKAASKLWNLNLPSLYFRRLMIGVQAVKNHKKLHVWHGIDQLLLWLTMNETLSFCKYDASFNFI